ncbi:hypothetical protein [Shewanella sp. DAU305]|uniref:hypothetical protein n=1 Tax=Shewanella sp. DAU305 TaxID=2991940 RepID=UPI002284A95E|nr:hypothetical protein [Shewanella sp. DAU305]WAL76839.1 hypothetical protein OX890_11695 [Shewanella sp. DAU305]
MDQIWTELQQAQVFKTFSDIGDPAHFYHANGFPLGVYAPLLVKLKRAFSLNALEDRLGLMQVCRLSAEIGSFMPVI